MPAVALMTNTPVEIDGEAYKVMAAPTPETVPLVRLADQKFFPTPLNEFANKIAKGNAIIKLPIPGDEIQRNRIRGKLKQEIQSLDDKTRAEFERRNAYVKGIEAYMPIPKTKERLTPIILDIATKIEDQSPPSFSTACRWLRDYITLTSSP